LKNGELFLRMKLFLFQGFEALEVLNCEVQTWVEVEKVFDQIDWNVFHILTILKADQSHCDISGNIGRDGLSASLFLEGEIYIIDSAPESLFYAKKILRDYFYDSQSTFEKYFKIEEKEFYKKTGKDQNGKSRFNLTLKLFIILGLISIPIYWIYKDDFKFLGRDTEFTRAKIIEIKVQNYGGRYFWQKVKFEFQVDSMQFIGFFRGGKRQGYSKLGDELKVKYLINDPSVNRYIGRFEKIRKPARNSSKYIEKPKFNYPAEIDSLE
jgi:hypothetical protein